MSDYSRAPAAESSAVIDCTECGGLDGMHRIFDLIDGLERKCGEIWTCAECGAEWINEW